MSEAEVWGHADSDQAERWYGVCASREDAIAEGRDHYGKDGFWIHSGTAHTAGEFVPDVDFIIDSMSERASDEVGEASEDFPYVSTEARKELEDLLEAWANKHIKCGFWTADGKAEYIPPEGTVA